MYCIKKHAALTDVRSLTHSLTRSFYFFVPFILSLLCRWLRMHVQFSNVYRLDDEAFACYIHVTTFMCNFRFLYPHFITGSTNSHRSLVSLIVFFFLLCSLLFVFLTFSVRFALFTSFTPLSRLIHGIFFFRLHTWCLMRNSMGKYLPWHFGSHCYIFWFVLVSIFLLLLFSSLAQFSQLNFGMNGREKTGNLA